jgi:lipopolysaccharide export system permease protein
MNLAYIFIVKLYFKRFLTFLIGAEIFFLLIDFLQNQKHLPNAANQIMLYVYYQAIAGLNLTLSLSLCFATISLFATISRTNEGMALLSLGFSKKQMSLAVAACALCVGISHVALMSTDVGRSYDAAQAILKGQNQVFDDGGLMFKFQNSLVTAERIDWLTSEAKGVRIFEFNDKYPINLIYAESAHYTNDVWNLKNATNLNIPLASTLDSNAIVMKTYLGDIQVLNGFWPKILDNLSNSQGVLSFSDLVKAIWLLSSTDLNIDKLRAKALAIFLTPFIVACAVLMLGMLAPLDSRGASWIKQSAIPSFVTLIIWGALMAIDKIMSSIAFGLWPLFVCGLFIFSTVLVWRKN